jgi:hypothetical protein
VDFLCGYEAVLLVCGACLLGLTGATLWKVGFAFLAGLGATCARARVVVGGATDGVAGAGWSLGGSVGASPDQAAAAASAWLSARWIVATPAPTAAATRLPAVT